MRTKQEIEDRVNNIDKDIIALHYDLFDAQINFPLLDEKCAVEDIAQLKIERDILKWVLNK